MLDSGDASGDFSGVGSVARGSSCFHVRSPYDMTFFFSPVRTQQIVASNAKEVSDQSGSPKT